MRPQNQIIINGEHFVYSKCNDDLPCTTCALFAKCEQIADGSADLCDLFGLPDDKKCEYHFEVKQSLNTTTNEHGK